MEGKNHDQRDKWNTLYSIWLVGLIMFAMIPLFPGVSATTVESTCEAAASPDTSYTWMVLPHAYNREVYMRWHVSADIGTGIDFTGAELNVRMYSAYAPRGTVYIYSTASWSGYSITGGSEPAETGNLSWSFSETLDGWQNVTASGTALTYLQNSYDSTGYVYLKFVDDGHIPDSAETWTCYPHPYGMADPNSSYPILRFTYTGGGGGATWKPAITSTPGTTYTDGVQYSYHATANTTVGWNSTYGINPEVTTWYLPKSATAQWRSISNNSSLTALVESQRTNLSHATLVFSQPTHSVDGTAGWGSAESANSWYMRIYYNGGWSGHITPYEDTSVKIDSPNQTYGSSVAIYANVRGWTGLAKFNLSTGGFPITNVEMNIYHDYGITGSGNNVTISAPISDSWVESTATWANYLGFSWVHLTTNMVSSTSGYYNLTLNGGTTAIPIHIVASMGAEFGPTASLRDTYQNWTIAAIAPPSYTSSPTTTVLANGAYSYHIVIDNHTYDATFVYENGPAWLTANFNNTVGESFYLNGTAPATNGTFTVRTSSENTYGKTWQNYTLTVNGGTPADYITVAFTAANNTAYLGEGTKNIFWNYTSGSYAFANYRYRQSFNNGSSWTNWTTPSHGYIDFILSPVTSTLWVRGQVYANDSYGYSGPTTESWWHFIVPPPPNITSTPVTTGRNNISYSYQVLADQAVTWNPIPTSGSITANVTLDAFVKSQFPDDNFGYDTNLLVDKGSGYVGISYLEWTGITVPVGTTITNAHVFMYNWFAVTPGGSFKVYALNDFSWTEGGVTYNTAPGSYWNFTTPAPAGYGWYDINVTAQAQYQLTNYGGISLGLEFLTDTYGDLFYSLENGYAVPYIVIDYSAPSWLTFNVGTGILSGTPTVAGTYDIYLSGYNTHGTAYQNFTITVDAGWKPTYTSTPTLGAILGNIWTYHVTLNETVTWTGFSLSGPVLPIYSNEWGTTSTGSHRTIIFIVTGSYNLTYYFRSVIGGQVNTQSWNVQVYLAMSISITSPANNTVIAYPWSLTVTWTAYSGLYPISYYEWRVYASGTWSGWSAHIVVTKTYTPTFDGRFEVRVVNTNGDMESDVIYYTLGPVLSTSISITSPANNSVVAYPWSLTVTWSATPGSVPISYYEYRIYTGAWSAWSVHIAVTSKTYTPTGDGRFEVKVVDTLGNSDIAIIYYTLGAVPPLSFTSTPVTSGTMFVMYTYTPTTNFPSTITLTIYPTWLHLAGGKVGGSPQEGHYTVQLKATLLGQTTWQNYSLTIAPPAGTYIDDAPPVWEFIIPFMALFCFAGVFALKRPDDGMIFDGHMFVCALTIGIFILVWAGAFGTLTLPALAFGIVLFIIPFYRVIRSVL